MSDTRTATAANSPKPAGRRSALLSLQDRVANVYYTHGLFCSTHPVPVILFATVIILVCCYPFVNLPLPGNAPQEFVTSAEAYSPPPPPFLSEQSSADVAAERIYPHWYRGPPVGYVQQILIRSAVSPWSDVDRTSSNVAADAFRGPLMKVFDVLEIVQNYQHPLDDGNGSVLLSDFCLHVAEAKAKRLKDYLPMYGCLCVSPANVWRMNMQNFLDDEDVIGTVLSLGKRNVADLSTSLADVLFGVPWKDAAIKKQNVQNRRRVITYAVTIIMSKYDAKFVHGLESRLHRSFPLLRLLNESSVATSSPSRGNITHVYFQGHYGLFEFIPLSVTYVILFLYIYFSVRKIEMVKSKIGMAFSAVVTVLASLCMSVGLCTWFGLSFTIRAGQVYLKDIFPYLVVIVGLENILVLTKSVVSTPVTLDVKVRLAQGLSKEGWSITKNLVTELSILTFGFFTFVPAIQEFCLFAVVGLLSDFFLQLVFFATILAVDIGRIEMSDLQLQSLRQSYRPSEEELAAAHMYPLFSWPLVSRWQRGEVKTSRALSSMTDSPSGYSASTYTNAVKGPVGHRLVKVPKRLRVAYFWARCRIFQKAFMFGFLVWVVFIIYKSGIVGLLTLTPDNSTVEFAANDSTTVSFPSRAFVASEVTSQPSPPSGISMSFSSIGSMNHNSDMKQQFAETVYGESQADVNVSKVLRHKELDLWRHLLPDHWPTLFGYFNLSLNARYVSILPSIKLSIPILPEDTMRARHISDQLLADVNDDLSAVGSKFTLSDAELMNKQWEDIEDDDDYDPPLMERIHRAYYPTTPAERVLAVILAIPSVAFLVYVMMVLYHLICSKNYAEWRSSWSSEGIAEQRTSGDGSATCGGDIFTQLVIEAMPVVLEGHPQEVECLATDGNFVVSTCLAGEIRVWDSMSGECLNVINRKRSLVRRQPSRTFKDQNEGELADVSDYESGSPPSRSDSFLARNGLNAVDCDPTDPNYAMINSRTSRSRSIGAGSGSTIAADLFKMQPNLAPTISTDFGSAESNEPPHFRTTTGARMSNGYDFDSRFRIYYDEHEQLMAEEEEVTAAVAEDDLVKRCPQTQTTGPLPLYRGSDMSPSVSRRHSPKSYTHTPEEQVVVGGQQAAIGEENFSTTTTTTVAVALQSAVWCVDCREAVIVAGCSDGKIEFWNTLTGALKYVHEEASHTGVTGIRIYGHRVIAVRLNGSVDFLEVRHVEGYVASTPPLSSASSYGSIYRRTNYQPEVENTCQPMASVTAEAGTAFTRCEEELVCHWLHSTKAHQQPITVLEVEGGKAVTGSQDHTLKVFKVDDTTCQFTLHGHYGPITTLFIDKLSPMTAASGSQDGAVCLWDLPTGTCVCRLRGHDGAVTALSYTASYVLSAATDNKLLVWERFQGHLLNTINLSQNYCNSIIMLTDNLLLTGRQGSLGIWDIRLGDPVRIVRLGNTDDSVLVRQVRNVGHTIVCDYGNQLRVVRFPAIVEKVD